MCACFCQKCKLCMILLGILAIFIAAGVGLRFAVEESPTWTRTDSYLVVIFRSVRNYVLNNFFYGTNFDQDNFLLRKIFVSPVF